MFRSRDQVELMQVAFPGVEVDALAAAVRTTGGAGRVGLDERGRAAFLTVGETHGRYSAEDARARWRFLRVGREGYGFDLAVAELADHLGASASSVVFRRFEDEVDTRLADGWHAVLVLPAGDREYRPVGKDAAGSRTEVREVRGWHLVTWVPAPGVVPAEEDVIAHLVSTTATGRSAPGVLVLLDAGHTTVLDVAKGEVVGGRHWPADLWPAVHPDGLEDVEPARVLVADVLADLVPQHADEDFTSWGADPVRRRSAFRGHPVDLPEVVAALGLPPETLDVLAGTSDLPVTTHEATTVGRATTEAMLDATAASRFPVVEAVSNVAGVVIAAVVLLLGRDTVPTWAWWGAIVIGVLSVLALATQVLAFRRRRRGARP